MLTFNWKVLFQNFFSHFKTKIKRGKRSGLYRTSAFLRTACKRAIRRKAGPSKPGFPPHHHTTSSSGGLRAIEFRVFEDANMAIVGPIKFAGGNRLNKPVPAVHEFGGIFAARQRFYHYERRSFMRTTLDKMIANGKLSREFTYGMAQQL